MSLCFLSQRQVTMLRSKVAYVTHYRFLDKLFPQHHVRDDDVCKADPSVCVCPSVRLISKSVRHLGAGGSGSKFRICPPWIL
jgi:hypothetical protein